MKHETKKTAETKKTYLEINKNYSIAFVLNKYETIKKQFGLFKIVCENSPMNFIRTLPLFLYLKDNFGKLSLNVITSKNKRIILITLTGNKKDYSFLPSKLWIKFITNWQKENGKNNDGYYTSANALYYNSKELKTTQFKFQLIVLKNSSSKKDILELKKDLLIVPSDTTCEFNKKGIYINENRDLKIYNSFNSSMFLKGKSYFLPILDPLLLSISNLFNLHYSISDKILNVKTKKDTKKKIQSVKKLLKVSKKLQSRKLQSKKK